MAWNDAKQKSPEKDGQYIVVFQEEQKFVVFGYYENGKWKVYDHYGTFWGDNVLYWMPLPEIP